MMDEDNGTDSEREGVDGLKVLATGGVAEEATVKSVAMVPLLPAQKRSRALSRDIGDNDQPSGIQKVEGNPMQVGRSKPWGMVRRGEGQSRDIQERRSAPHYSTSTLEKELRSCRSAPNLALPALQATVRGLQDGTIQVDRHMRLQIASAAKRVLEAREAKRRLSQEQKGLPGSTPGCRESVPAPATPQTSKPSVPQEEISLKDLGPTLSNADKVAEAPTSLATAAAIARGESLPMGPRASLTRVASDAAAAPMQFHKPAALGTARMGGSLVTSPHKHTVTTGLPKFCEGSHSASPGSKGSGTTLTRQPLVPRSSHSASVLDRVPSKTLTVNDLFKSEGPSSKAQD